MVDLATFLRKITESLLLRSADTPVVRLVPDDGRSIFPPHIWESCFRQLSDVDIMATAIVCSTFNEISCTAQLIRNGVTREDIGTGNLSVDAGLLRTLRSSLFTPPITRLVCTFGKETLLQDLRVLHDVVLISRELRELELNFPEYAFAIEEDQIERHWYHLHGAFHDVMHAQSSKVGGLVVGVDPLRQWSSSPQEICQQQFEPRYWTPDDAFLSRFSERKKSPMDRFMMPPRVAYAMCDITSVQLRSLPGPDSMCTMIVTNSDLIREFHIGQERISQDWSIPGRLMTALLPHLRLPGLQSLHIHEEVPSTVLRDFLTHNQTIEKISYSPIHSEIPRALVKLPALSEIESATGDGLISLMVSFEDSKPRNLVLRPDVTERIMGAHRAFFEKLAERTTDTVLQLVIMSFDDTDLRIARSLKCVVSVVVRSCFSLWDATYLLPWLSALPSLEIVEFVPLGYENRGEEQEQLVNRVREALGREIEVKVRETKTL
ncbi:hypothetical protein B0H11DRAFT_2051671 [Mycena galericulata]|nr:hypothetical protein B0H11DRAFT_2051671 [Mycena galericulata]